MTMIQQLCFVLACLLALVTLTTSAKKFRPPHLILIVADDLGWNDVGFHGSPQIPTPNLNRLASGGITLDNYYVQPVCTPSRSALMTGLYPIHTGMQHDVIYANEPWGLPLHHKLLPEYLKELGYANHMVGKWHLGFYKKEYTPNFRGFESSFGYWTGRMDYYDHTTCMSPPYWGMSLKDNFETATNYSGQYATDVFTQKAVNIILRHNGSQPLFLYLAHLAVHSANNVMPLQAPPKYVDRVSYIKDKNRRIFGGMMSAVDDSVGAVMQALHIRGFLKNSVVVFTTDNGGPAAGFNSNAASNWPLRGVKATLWEGGVRGAALIWSPLLLQTPTSFQGLMHITDWLPTLYHCAGGDSSQLDSIDGSDMWDSLSYGFPSLRDHILLNIDPKEPSNGAIRVGDFKLIYGRQFDGKWNGWYGPSGRENTTSNDLESLALNELAYEVKCGSRPVNASFDCKPAKGPCLFNIKEDPCEYRNLASSHPEILSSLWDAIERYNATAKPPGNKPADPSSAPNLHGYAWISWRDEP